MTIENLYLLGAAFCCIYYITYIRTESIWEIIAGFVLSAFSWIGLLALLVGRYLKKS